MKYILLIAAMVLLLSLPAHADRGPVIWQDRVNLVQESQKAIIMHNGSEECLVLSTEMKASRDVEILEFIPFPSEPMVRLAGGDPFGEISGLITRKGLVFYRGSDVAVKGEEGIGGGAVAVEISFAQKIGIHDVTVIKVNDPGDFKEWCEKFFHDRGIKADNAGLSRVYEIARDYTQRGYTYFVFDRVNIARETKSIEPLLYRFKSRNIYYPLKTSNLFGGSGIVELIFLLPGSIMDDFWQNTQGIFDIGRGHAMELSSSSKVYQRDLGPFKSLAGFFAPGSKIYMQVLRYKGAYAFADDLAYDTGKLKPYAYRFESSRWQGEKEFTAQFTEDEIRDLKEYFCPKSGDLNFMFDARNYNIDCWNFIPADEYEVYAAVFKNPPLGIPRNAIIEKMTSKKEFKDTKLKLDGGLVKDFNQKNRISQTLERGFPDDGRLTISVADNASGQLSRSNERTYVSRVGFNRDRSMALVHVDHISGPRSGVAYYLTLKKKTGSPAWAIADAIIEMMY